MHTWAQLCTQGRALLSSVVTCLTLSQCPPGLSSHIANTQCLNADTAPHAPQAVFFSGWKQEALFTLSAWLSHLLSTLAAQQGALLSYIPTCYTDVIVDFMKLLLKAENRFETVGSLCAFHHHTHRLLLGS